MRNIVYRKEYKNLRSNVFQDLGIADFMEVWTNYVRLKMQYRLLCMANYIERINISIVEIPVLRLLSKIFNFMRWKIYDFIMFLINGRVFNLYGVTCYCGRQGGGKTIGIVERLESIKRQFPDAIICTNINYIKQDLPLTSWLQLLYLRNGNKGVVFVIDEVQNNRLGLDKISRNFIASCNNAKKAKDKNICISTGLQVGCNTIKTTMF